MVVFPKAKINIGLNIIGKRTDGYHNIETLFLPVGLCDALEFVPAGQGTANDELTVSGSMNGVNPADNLVFKAVKLLRQRTPFPRLRIHLHKVIPTGSGLGGGSSDASSMLVGLNRYFSLGFTCEELQNLALELGSDCPVFISGTPAFASGRGEIFEPAPKIPDGLRIVIVHEGIHISTPEAYRNSRPAIPAVRLRELTQRPAEEWRDTIRNDFEEYAFGMYPQLADIKASMYRAGAIYSSMSGSGSAVYGLFMGEPRFPEKIKGTIIFKGEI